MHELISGQIKNPTEGEFLVITVVSLKANYGSANYACVTCNTERAQSPGPTLYGLY